MRRVLSRWGDPEQGEQVTQEKETKCFGDELVGACAKMARQRWSPHPKSTQIYCVPSLRHLGLVPDFAQRLAAKFDLPLTDTVEEVVDNPLQKVQQSRFH